MKLKYYVQLYKCNHLLNDRLNENLFFIGLDKIALTWQSDPLKSTMGWDGDFSTL